LLVLEVLVFFTLCMNIEELRQTIEKLDLTYGEYAVLGSGTLLALALVDCIEDIDIVVTPKEFNRILAFHITDGNGIFIELNSIKVEIFKDWFGMDVMEIIKDSISIEGISYASLFHVIKFKRILKRPKDLEHINIIEKYIKIRDE